MHDEPGDPTEEPGELDRAHLRNGGAAADRRHRSLVVVAEAMARPSAQDLAGDVAAGLHRGRRQHRQGLALAIGGGGAVADREHVVDTEHAEMVVDRVAVLIRSRHGRMHCDFLGADSRGPHDGRGRQLGSVARRYAELVGGRDEHVGANVYSAMLELAPRVRGEAALEHRQHAVAAFEQHDPQLVGVQLGVLVRQHQPRQLGERARVLHPGRPAADDAERQQSPALGGIRRRGRLFEAVEHVVAQLQRLTEILQPERTRRDRLVAVVVGDAARCQHQLVVIEHFAVGERHTLAREVGVDHFALAVADVRRAAQHLAQRGRDLRRVQQATGDLVEQRREQVVVLPVDEQHVDRLDRAAPWRTAARRSPLRR